MSEQGTGEVKLEIHLDDETAQGVYVNMAVVNHNDAEFTVDFIYAQPQGPRAKVRSRIITSPRHLKRLIAALQENLQRYEQAFGQIPATTPSHVDDANYH